MFTDNFKQVYIAVRLFATLGRFMPVGADKYYIRSGITVQNLLKQLSVPEKEVKLVFINGVKGDFKSVLKGGERVGIFPSIGGG